MNNLKIKAQILIIVNFYIFASMKIKAFIFCILFALLSTTIYAQVDSLSNRLIYNWTLSPSDLNLVYADTDTSLESFQQFNPILQSTITSNYLGNLGTASQSNIYYDRQKHQTGFIFSEPYAIYFHLPYEHKYFNTKRPYSLFSYGNGGKKEENEQLLSILHTQNVNQDFNVGIDYDLISAAGRYQRQALKVHAATLFTSYQYKGYRVHANYTLNKAKGEENGGIDSLRYLGSNEYQDPNTIPVKLSDANILVQNNSFHLVQEFRFGKFAAPAKKEEKTNQPGKTGKPGKPGKKTPPVNNKANPTNIKTEKPSADTLRKNIRDERDEYPDSLQNLEKSIPKSASENKIAVPENGNGFSISHELKYNKDMRKFYDANIDEPFYDSLDKFLNLTKTYDAAYQKLFSNKISVNYRYKDKFSTSLSFYNEQLDYEYKTDTIFQQSDTLINNLFLNSYNSNSASFYLGAELFNHFIIDGIAEYFINGYKQEDSRVNLLVGYKWKTWLISLEGNYKNKKPDYFYKQYSSNHFRWDNNNLIRQEEWDGNFVIRNNKYRLEARAGYGQITGHIYLNSSAYVKQYGNQINILTGEISKKFKIGPFHTDTRFVYQKSTNDSLLCLPEYNLYQSAYYEKLFYFKSTGGNLLMHAGIDYRYSSSFMADGYMPVTGLFYRQYDQMLDDYHCFDIFFNFTLKRARIYLIYNYLNSAINETYFYNAPSYPAQPAVFKFGFAWTFYD